MKITYDHNLKVAGVGMVPWRRLGPEQWFPHYAIASLYDGGGAEAGPRVVSLSSAEHPASLPRRNTRALLTDKTFQDMLEQQLPGYDLMLYRATDTPEALSDRTFIMPNEQLVRLYENKAWFRKEFMGLVPFAPFSVVSKSELQASEDFYEGLRTEKGGMVLQDPELSGGQGTYVVRDFDAYQRALVQLTGHTSTDTVVSSELIEGAAELSMQGCITRADVFTGPVQRQIIRDPVLSDPTIPGASSFCGIQISAKDQGTELHEQLSRITRTIGEKMQLAGYRGIFGVDFLWAKTGELYTLEVNPRITGATPLLSALYRGEEGVPFYLLHILELGEYAYEITDETHDFDKDGALLVVHSLEHHPVQVHGLPVAGTYVVQDGNIRYVSARMSLADLGPQEFIIQPQVQVGATVPAGGMIAALQFNKLVIDTEHNKLYNDTTEVISAVRKAIGMTHE